MGKGLVDEFRDIFSLEEEWVPFELQPETPSEGRLLTDKFQPHEITAMFEHLRQRGSRYGMVFNDRERSSNSHMALVAGQFAKGVGHFEMFHEKLFKAFFTDLKDIGKPDILLDIATDSGLSPKELTTAFADSRYEDSLHVAAAEARRLGIRSIPAFVFEGDEIIYGAQSPEKFRDALQDIKTGTYRSPLILKRDLFYRICWKCLVFRHFYC